MCNIFRADITTLSELTGYYTDGLLSMTRTVFCADLANWILFREIHAILLHCIISIYGSILYFCVQYYTVL